MAPQQRYVLKDFVNYGRLDFPNEFASVADSNIFNFDNKTCVNDDQQPREATMLLLGRYHYTQRGSALAWAYATTSGISYYSGKAGRVCKIVPPRFQTRIYHDHPFDLMFTLQGPNSHGHDPTQMVKECVIETMINFAFLRTGRIDHVDNVKGMDMLTNFRFACLNFCMNSGLARVAEPSLLEPHRAGEVRKSGLETRRQVQQAVLARYGHVPSQAHADQVRLPLRDSRGSNVSNSESPAQRKSS
jgi:hypothetical protein